MLWIAAIPTYMSVLNKLATQAAYDVTHYCPAIYPQRYGTMAATSKSSLGNNQPKTDITKHIRINRVGIQHESPVPDIFIDFLLQYTPDKWKCPLGTVLGSFD
jgi:hypothetical protein